MKKNLRIKRRDQTLTFNDTDISLNKNKALRGKNVTVLKKVTRKNTPLPGTLEQDFLLETKTCLTEFFESTSISQNEIGPRFDDKGDPVRHSYVGPNHLFESSRLHKYEKRLTMSNKPRRRSV